MVRSRLKRPEYYTEGPRTPLYGDNPLSVPSVTTDRWPDVVSDGEDYEVENEDVPISPLKIRSRRG